MSTYNREFIQSLDRSNLRRALRFLRRQNKNPYEPNPAAAQYDGLATLHSLNAEYKRRNWKLPKYSAWEKG